MTLNQQSINLSMQTDALDDTVSEDWRAIPAPLIWHSPSENSLGSMPLGNGDISLNVWCQSDGRLRCYIGKTDAWDETGRLAKVGAFDLQIHPNPFGEDARFTQTLHPQTGMIEITSLTSDNELCLKVWVDANAPVIHVQADAVEPIKIQIALNLWRKHQRQLSSQENSKPAGLSTPEELQTVSADHVVDMGTDTIGWYHRNIASPWKSTLQLQSLDCLQASMTDPLMDLTFGAAMTGYDLVKKDDQTLASRTAVTHFKMRVIPLTAQTPTATDWIARLNDLKNQVAQQDIYQALVAHEKWWSDFWDRSWIDITSGLEHAKVTQAYALQRFVFACQGRGVFPIKFNGGTFTMEAPAQVASNDQSYDADYRRWGGGYWFQNTRLMYWAMLNSGDYDMMLPLFDMYLDMLPLAKARTKTYFDHGGVFFPETVTFWGTYLNGDYGLDRKDRQASQITNQFMRHYWQGALELIAMGLDYHSCAHDESFLKNRLLPLAKPIIQFYIEHYPNRDDQGKVLIKPAQSLETWHVAVNPLPDIAGLQWVLEGLLACPDAVISEPQRHAWERLRQTLPAIPTRTYTSTWEPYFEKHTALLPAYQYDLCANAENPPLYAVFPYRLFGVGKPDLDVGLATWKRREVKTSGCWSQDPIHAAMLGLANDAMRDVVKNVTDFNTTCRFPVFWDAGHDWIPDMDHGGVTMTALQRMLIQADDGKIYLMPAWPKSWDARFKLHTLDQTIVEGHVAQGELVWFKTHPSSRAKDVILCKSC